MTDEAFEFEVPAYSKGTVIRLLEHYLDIRLSILDRMPTPTKPLYSNNERHTFREKPLGSSGNSPWPFMSRPHATKKVDGKKRARMMEDLHCATLDLENALATLDKDEYDLVADYYIYGSGTLEDLAAARGLLSKGRLHDKLQRIVSKLVRRMNNGYIQS